MKFRKRFTIVEAVQWLGNNLPEVEEFLRTKANRRFWQHGSLLYVSTEGGDKVCGVGMWFIVDENGLKVMENTLFLDHYEPLKTKEGK